jgi:hypothetical protein
MNICVAGWYFNRALMDALIKFQQSMPVDIVAHRPEPVWDHGIIMPIVCHQIPNKGLEFGCYNYYLEFVWPEEGNTLFIHDDNEITQEAFDVIAGMTVDQAFLFGSEEEIKSNGGAHGRAILCSERFLKQLKSDGGFWYDESQNGTQPTTKGPDYHNNAIQVFRAYCIWQEDMVTNKAIVVPGLKCGYRGEVK